MTDAETEEEKEHIERWKRIFRPTVASTIVWDVDWSKYKPEDFTWFERDEE